MNKTTRVPWDEYEAVLLIEAYLKVKNGNGSRSQVLQELSESLRYKAIKEGKQIDDIFRNFNGMSFMFNIIDNTFHPNKYSIHSSNLFSEMVDLYNKDPNRFYHLLDKAHLLINKNEPKRYVFHEKYGYGIINLEESGVLHIKFVDISEVKKIQKGHPSVRNIEESEFYAKVPQEAIAYLNQDINTVHNSENLRDAFFSYIFDSYKRNHPKDKDDFKANRHARKCIEVMNKINSIFSVNVFKMTSKDELSLLFKEINNRKQSFLNSEYDWFVYDIRRYSFFLNDWKKKKTQIVIKDNICIDIDPTEYRDLIDEFFDNGFSFNNPLQKRKFVRLYSEKYNKEFNDTDGVYLQKIKKVGFITDEKVYPFSIVSETLRDEIKNYLIANLSECSSAVYYSNLFENFSGQLNPIFDEKMLKEYLLIVFKNEFNFDEYYVSMIGKETNIKKLLIDVFIKTGRPLEKEELYRELPNISQEAINYFLNERDFIVNIKGKSYFYKDIFIIEDEELNEIRNFISMKIKDQICLSGAELNLFIQKNLPNVIESNPEITDLGIRNAIKYYLDEDFSFKGDVISDSDDNIDVKTLYYNFSKQREKFSYQELEEFRDQIHKKYIDYDAVFQNSIRINKDNFVRKDLVVFDVELIDKALEKYCEKSYVSFCDIINFIEFPSIQYVWNNFVLESYLFSCSKKFKLVHTTFNKDTPVGGIVKKASKIDNIDDLLVCVIKENKLFNRERAFDYLIENKFILTRKVKNIDILIDRAKQEV